MYIFFEYFHIKFGISFGFLFFGDLKSHQENMVSAVLLAKIERTGFGYTYINNCFTFLILDINFVLQYCCFFLLPQLKHFCFLFLYFSDKIFWCKCQQQQLCFDQIFCVCFQIKCMYALMYFKPLFVAKILLFYTDLAFL